MYQKIYENMGERIRTLMEDEVINARRKLSKDCIENRKRNIKLYNLKKLEKTVLNIKKNSISRVDELISLAKESLERNGIHVCVAKTSKDALDYVLKVVGNEKIIAQSSTDLPAEIGLYDACKKLDIEVIHTELGYRFLQFMPEVMLCYKPVPVPHIKREKIAHRLSEKLCKEVAPTPEGIVYAARDDVVEALSKTKIGITGANAIAAQEGAISFCFDQMNITRVTHLPTHIAIAGIEKLVPTMLDAMKVVYLLSFYEGGTGAQCYLTIRGPSLSADVERQLVPGVYGAKDVHLVLLDNGRKQMIEEGFEQALYCIRCFACANYCPIHEVLGPGAGFGCETPGFGYKGYCGGQGIILTAFTQGVEKAIDSGLYLCTLCESCVKHCPLEIEAPRMIKKLRKKVAKELGGEV